LRSVAGYLARSVFDRGERQTSARRLCGDGLKNWFLVSGARRPARSLFLLSLQPNYRLFTIVDSSRSVGKTDLDVRRFVSLRDERDKTLSGGSLGSCVDEERSQLREVM
jgi:hypothetical protein